ncbi:TPA: hypothetical protein TVE77_001766 [Streptococcus equi subsp. zooepidemicus]|uniref:Uncharacterized protein n=1 Tax=Streptococcus equi subsp. ruminatorum CECT 5772 TaxID=1051981 RepID=A0A922T6G6_9STRE|nr:hypothetical protein [Streptococcus equi]KED05308.1 hypothetical protein CECT5772_00696 [Streptococcus equi subsp. ruminatorum CECT 5772]MCD3386894.1 hypothetical protein [Streptococcus equi subsp. zooepidemicus]MCD3410348.1 hypothetical protein [Streptococcus equi subsp. zooepidemicus]HEK9981578.1 hypothetical protein [Streptococcus equi subsp. zooepidemicus]HEL0238384.1 hypothetical protein [Streptococcus equi subsp. zooepidemicus]
MSYLMIGIIILSIIVLVLGFFLLYYQAIVVSTIKKDFDKMRRELEYEFGFDEYDPSCNFSVMRRDLKKAVDDIKDINSLPLIKKAKEVKRLEDLQRTKDKAEKEIAELTRNGG